MDPNAKLDEVRHAIGRAQMFQGMGSTGANYVWALERAADAFTVLDAHLRAGGAPPEEWREGPDAVGEDRQEPDADEAPARVRVLDRSHAFLASGRDGWCECGRMEPSTLHTR